MVFTRQHDKQDEFSNYGPISEPSQRWKLKNGTLNNKGRLWQSNAHWIFKKFDETLIKIKDNVTNMVLGADTGDSEEEEEGNLGQLWIQGKKDTEGYFTLENLKLKKLMTASNGSLAFQGKCISFVPCPSM